MPDMKITSQFTSRDITRFMLQFKPLKRIGPWSLSAAWKVFNRRNIHRP